MRFVYILLYLLPSLLYYDYNNAHFRPARIVESLRLGASSSWIIGHKDFSQDFARDPIDGVVKSLLIGGFNVVCNNIYASYMKVGDESISSISFQTKEKGILPHLLYIFATQKLVSFSSLSFLFYSVAIYLDRKP